MIELLPVAGAGLLIIIVTAAALWLGRGRFRAPSAGRPNWLVPDPVRIQAEARARMDELRWAKRMEPLRTDASLDALAHHRASSMAVGMRQVGLPEEDRTVEGQRRLLYPELLGPLDCCVAGADGRRGDVERCVTAITDQLSAAGSWFEPQWTAGAIGLATGQGRISVCAVLARRLAILDEVEWTADADGCPVVHAPRLVLTGVRTEGLSAAARFRMHRPSGAVEEVKNEARGRRLSLVLNAHEEGGHTLYADEDVLFRWRFVDPRK